jgi:hypothetical protein
LSHQLTGSLLTVLGFLGRFRNFRTFAVMPENASNNPYANPDGTPKAGQAAQFWQFMQEKRDEELNTLSTEEKRERAKGEDRLAKRMDS